MVFEIVGVAILIVAAYSFGVVRGRRGEARWWTGAVYAAGPRKLEWLQGYIAGWNPRSSEPHHCAEELATHLVVPYVGDHGKAVVLPADWSAAAVDADLEKVSHPRLAATRAARMARPRSG